MPCGTCCLRQFFLKISQFFVCVNCFFIFLQNIRSGCHYSNSPGLDRYGVAVSGRSCQIILHLFYCYFAGLLHFSCCDGNLCRAFSFGCFLRCQKSLTGHRHILHIRACIAQFIYRADRHNYRI